MRVGIITVPFNNNYGGYLQAYALMEIIRQLGHNPTIIMRRHNKPNVSLSYKIKYFVKGIIRILLKGKFDNLFYNCENDFRLRGKNMHTFVNKFIQPQTMYVYTTQELRKECEGRFDAIIVGSDQVWRAIYVPGIIGNMFLDFTEGWDINRLSYAASFGTENPEYTEEEKSLCGKLIQKFNAVSVREEGGLRVLENFNWKVNNPQVVLDPTLLLEKEVYNKLIPQVNSYAQGHIFSYVLDISEESRETIYNIQNQLRKPLYEITDIQKGNSVLPSIELWLSAIRDSDFVITDSFHGTVFSIIFKKPFIVLGNNKRGSERFSSLLSQIGLSDRLLSSSELIHIDDIQKQINWPIVEKHLFDNRNTSLSFLKNNLI